MGQWDATPLGRKYDIETQGISIFLSFCNFETKPFHTKIRDEGQSHLNSGAGVIPNLPYVGDDVPPSGHIVYFVCNCVHLTHSGAPSSYISGVGGLD